MAEKKLIINNIKAYVRPWVPRKYKHTRCLKGYSNPFKLYYENLFVKDD